MDAQKNNIASICALLEQHYHHAKIALNYTNTYQLLVAVTLSAQTTDKAVNKVTDNLFLSVKTPQDLLNYSTFDLERLLSALGLYRSKARYLRLMSQQLIDEFDGVVPNSAELLESLAGVGKKTAYVVLNEAFGQETIAVDTHVFRVVKRLALSQARTPYMMMNDLHRIVPHPYKKSFHHYVIFFGRERCKARSPLCKDCFLMQYCDFYLNMR